MVGSQISTMYVFGTLVMNLWTALPVLRGGDESRSMAILNGVLEKLWGSDPKEAHNVLAIRKMAWAGLNFAASSLKTSLQIVTCIGDQAVDNAVVNEFYQLTRHVDKWGGEEKGAQRSAACAFPSSMPHAWPVVNSYPSGAWWLSSARASLVRYMILGEHFPLKDGTQDECFVDVVTDSSLGQAPFNGASYTAEYWTYRGTPVTERRNHFTFSTPGGRGNVWRMLRLPSKFAKLVGSSKWVGSVQPLLAHNPDQSDSVTPLLLERRSPTVSVFSFSNAALRQPVRKALLRAPGGECRKVSVRQKYRKLLATGDEGEGKMMPLSCVKIPVVVMMQAGQPDQMVNTLLHQIPHTSNSYEFGKGSLGNKLKIHHYKRTYTYCTTKKADLNSLIHFFCRRQ